MFKAADEGLVNPFQVESILGIQQPHVQQGRSETSLP